MPEALIEEWFEEDWGLRSDGFSLHRDEAALDRYNAAQVHRYGGAFRPMNRRTVEVDDATWAKLQTCDGLSVRLPPDAP